MKKSLSLFLSFLFLLPLLYLPLICAGGSKDPAPPTADISTTNHSGSTDEGYHPTPGVTASVYTYNNSCYDVKTTKSYFIPTRTALEWLFFYDARVRLGITIDLCRILLYNEAIDRAEEIQAPQVVIDALIADAVSGAAPTLTPEQLALKNSLITLADTNNEIGFENSRLSYSTEIFFWSCESGGSCDPSDYPSKDSYTAEEWGGLQKWEKDLILSADVMKEADTNLDSLDIQQTAAEVNLDDAYSDYIVVTADTSDNEIYLDEHESYCASHGCVEIGCFTANTLINTPKGIRNIASLNIGDYVISYNLNKNQFVESKIEKVFIHEKNTSEYYLIKTKNSQVEVTSIHPFYIGSGKYELAENLKLGDIIYINKDNYIIPEKILSKERIILPKPITVYNLELDKNSPKNYFANKYLVHNKYTE